MDEKRLRFRLGLFVVISGILLAVLILMFGSSGGRLFTRLNEYNIPFENAPGVTIGTPAPRPGAKFAPASKVEWTDETGVVLVTIAVERKYTVRTTDVAEINQDLLSRDTSIDIIRRPASTTLQPPKPAASRLNGEV